MWVMGAVVNMGIFMVKVELVRAMNKCSDSGELMISGEGNLLFSTRDIKW